MAGKGRERLITPTEVSGWQTPDISVFPANVQEKWKRRRQAISMYANGEPFDEIRRATGVCDTDVRRFIGRCLAGDGTGDVTGFFGIIPGRRQVPYTRKIVNAPGIMISDGLAGVLRQTLDRFPKVEIAIQRLFLGKKNRGEVIGSPPSYQKVHKAFLVMLRSEFTTLNLVAEHEWPFNTRDMGYRAIRVYCKGLETSDDAAVLARIGDTAGAKLAIGTGHESLLQNLRPFTFAQLDYHLIDSSCILQIETSDGIIHKLPIARWYFGILAEERSGAVLGIHCAFEPNPSADAALETVESAFNPIPFKEGDSRIKYCSDGCVLLTQMMPEIANQTFSVLKVDNGWANVAKDFLHNVIEVVGCAVCFGSPRHWWLRDLIERIIEELTQQGLQRLRSTTGSSPTDPRRTNPPKAAQEDEIFLTDIEAIIYGCVQNFNTAPTERIEFANPLEYIKAKFADLKNGFIYAPLPKSGEESNSLMWHTRICTVAGRRKKGTRPYFTFDGIEHTSTDLAKRWDLIGEQLLVKVGLRDPRIVKATIIKTGEQLHEVTVRGAWRKSNASYRDRKLRQAAGERRLRGYTPKDPVQALLDEKNSKRATKNALAAAKALASNQRPENVAAHQMAESICNGGQVEVDFELPHAPSKADSVVTLTQSKNSMATPTSQSFEPASTSATETTESETPVRPAKTSNRFGLGDVPNIANFRKR